MKVRHVLIPTVVGGLGLAAGFVLGHDRGFNMAMEFQLTEVRGGLIAHGDALCQLRLSDTANAVRVLEAMLDNAACSLPQDRPVAELPVESQRALAAAKVYRTAYPPNSPNPELERVLAQVPLPDFKFCSNPGGNGLDKVRESLRGR